MRPVRLFSNLSASCLWVTSARKISVARLLLPRWQVILRNSGIDNFIRFVAILSIMLGVMNLLPIPVLDGGHLMYYFIEIIKGSPVSDRIQMVGYKVGFSMLMGLMVFATYNDVMRPF